MAISGVGCIAGHVAPASDVRSRGPPAACRGAARGAVVARASFVAAAVGLADLGALRAAGTYASDALAGWTRRGAGVGAAARSRAAFAAALAAHAAAPA